MNRVEDREHDGVLVHAYMYDPDHPDGPDIGDRNRLQEEAVVRLVQEGKVGVVYLLAGDWFENGKQTQSELMRQRLLDRGIPSEIILPEDPRNATARSTKEELGIFSQEIDGRGLRTPASLVTRGHRVRVREKILRKNLFKKKKKGKKLMSLSQKE